MSNNLHSFLPVEMENDAYFKSIFDNALYGIGTTIGTDFLFVRVNDAFCRLLEYDRDELVGVRSIADVTLPDDYPRNKRLLSRLINNEIQRFQIDKQYVTKSGRCIDVIVFVQGFYDNEGKYIGSTGSIMDVSEQKKIERELKNSEQQYRNLVDNSLVGVFISTLDGRFKYVNDALVRLGDFDTSELMMGQSVLSLWKDPKQRERMLHILREHGSVTNFEAEIITHTGRYIHVLFSATLIGDNIHGMVMDVTEIHQARKDLQTSQDNLIRAQEVAHIGSWNLDLLKNKLVWTDESYKIFGIPKGNPLTYEEFLNQVHPEDRDYVDRKWRAALIGEPYDIEHRILVDNEVKWVREKAELIFDDKGRPIRGVGTTQDITETKELLQELSESKKESQKLAGRLLSVQEEERRRLARELHDDLAQRLALMSIEAGKFNAEGCDTETADIIHNLQEKLINISEDIHRISRQLHPSIIEDLGLEEALRSEIHNFSKLEEIPVKFEYERGLANPSMEIAVSLFRVTQECLRNIKKHACAKNVSVKMAYEDDSILLTICDDGIGFVSDLVKKMPGLGLRSMRERMRLIGGGIAYLPRPGKGTTVEARVDIPV